MEIIHHKFSLFITEKTENPTHPAFKITKGCFEFINTFDTLEEAKSAKKEYEEETIILPSY